jgi:hypothetical protein
MCVTHLSELLASDLRDHGFCRGGWRQSIKAIARLKTGAKGIHPFHWGLEFPEVFAVNERGEQAGGFDVIVGNPPFAGKNTLIAAHPEAYPDWLKTIHAESHGNADLVAHFFRSSFDLLRQDGCLGLIATNTIGQGDTRSTGLRWICCHGGTIYRATKRLRWPGEAAVVVSVVHISRGRAPGQCNLNGRFVDRITPFLFHDGGNEDPARLEESTGKSFQGCIILGLGFTFDDSDKKRIASPISEMHRLIELNPANASRVFPYIGGEELNSSPVYLPSRFVISFEDFPLARKASGHSWFQLTEENQRKQLRDGIVAPDYPRPVAEDWPDLLSVLEARVKPERLKQNDEGGRIYWWRFLRPRPELNQAMTGLNRALVTGQTSKHRTFCFMPCNLIFDQKIIVFPEDSWSFFAVMSSRLHENWATFMGSTMKDDPVYTPSDCFENFPFPELYRSNTRLDAIGEAYANFRSALMIHNDEGLTKTYNRFHDPNEDSAGIRRLRELHAAIDRDVLDAYGWQDIQPVCEFFPEFDDGDEEDEGGRPKKKKFRYRWREEVHDQVLALLLDLNRQRALEEGQIPVPENPTNGPWADTNMRTPKKDKRKTKAPDSTEPLFATTDEEA